MEINNKNQEYNNNIKISIKSKFIKIKINTCQFLFSYKKDYVKQEIIDIKLYYIILMI